MKLFYKYYLMVAIPLFACLVILGIGLSFQMYNYSVSEKHEALEQAAERISSLTEELYYNRSLSHERMLKTILTSMTNDKQIHIVICDENGQIFLTSDSYGNNFIDAQVDSGILKQIQTSGQYSSTGTLGGLYRGESYTVGTSASNALGAPVAYIFVTTSIENVHMLMTHVKNSFIFLAVIVFLLTSVSSYFIVKKMTKPLKQIALTSRKFACGNFSARVPNESSDEIGELTDAFNNMADSLEKSEELRRSFIGNVSHELRSPMTSISGFIDGILDGTIPPERSKHYLTIVSGEVHRLSRLVSRMLDITVLQGTDITEQSTHFDFCELLRRAVLSFEQRITDNSITVNVDIPAYPVNILANEDAIYQVVYNLIDNAVKFSFPESNIDIKASDHSGKLTFSIKNYGTEIPEDQLKVVFDRFHKTDKSRSKDKGGLGLGLYIAKTIIDQHHGKISAVSRDGYTEFSFTIFPRGIR